MDKKGLGKRAIWEPKELQKLSVEIEEATGRIRKDDG